MSKLIYNYTIVREEQNEITDIDLETLNEITFKPPSGKEVLFRKVKYGEWNLQEINEDHEYEWFCSECKGRNDIKTKFCPFCGADMKGGDNYV